MSPDAVPRLIIRAPNAPELVFELAQPVVRIGRSPAPQNDLVLPDNAVSRAHARIYCDREPLRIQDVGSSNGTALNDQPLPPNELHPLTDGDVIAIGPFRLTFVAAVVQPEEPAPAPIELPARPLPAKAGAAAPPPSPPAGQEVTQTPAPQRWVGMPDEASRWLAYLPPIYSEDQFLGRYLLIFEDLMGPLEQAIGHFDLYLDPETCPEAFLPVLAGWLGLDLAERWPLNVKRQLVKHGAWLHRARGTLPGLRRHLEICSGGQVEISENAERPHTLAVHIQDVPHAVDRPLLEAVIRHHCPAHVGYSLEIDEPQPARGERH